MPAVLELKNVQKNFEDHEVLKSVNLSLQKGEFLCLLGPSGCGKSTLLRLMAGLENPTSGQVSTTDKEFAFVFQEANLLSWRNVLENTRLPLELQAKTPVEEQNKKARTALDKVNLLKFENYFPHQISGGMKMRVSFARALSSSPNILFMDEPFSALDEVTRFSMQRQIKALCEKENLSVVFVTHSTYEAAFLADRILLMKTKGGDFVMDEKVSFEGPRTEELRTKPEYQSLVAKLSNKMQDVFV